MTHNIFFVQAQNGKGKSLFTIAGQRLTSRTALVAGCMTHGCESVRKKYPVGTVFYTPSEQVKFRSGCYVVLSLVPLLLPQGKPVSNDIFSMNIIEEYHNL